MTWASRSYVYYTDLVSEMHGQRSKYNSTICIGISWFIIYKTILYFEHIQIWFDQHDEHRGPIDII